MEHNQSAVNPTNNGYDNKYKFNGKELDDATGMYYYGARYYDPRISIFISVDPLAEQTMTPYQYVSNNPIMRIDPTGMEDHDYKKNKETGRLEMVRPTGDDFDKIIASDGSELIVDKGVINDKNRINGTAVRQKSDLNGNLIKDDSGNYINESINVEADIYKFDNEQKARAFYDFMVNPDSNDVEFSLSDIENSSGRNFYVGTIGSKGNEAAWSYSFKNEYSKDKTTRLNSMTHNHMFSIDAGPSPQDVNSFKQFYRNYPTQNTKFYIDCWGCIYGSPRVSEEVKREQL